VIIVAGGDDHIGSVARKVQSCCTTRGHLQLNCFTRFFILKIKLIFRIFLRPGQSDVVLMVNLEAIRILAPWVRWTFQFHGVALAIQIWSGSGRGK
jgi:hypothetical protein